MLEDGSRKGFVSSDAAAKHQEQRRHIAGTDFDNYEILRRGHRCDLDSALRVSTTRNS